MTIWIDACRVKFQSARKHIKKLRDSYKKSAKEYRSMAEQAHKERDITKADAK